MSTSIKLYNDNSKSSGIYKATCTTNGMFYIGSCATFRDRWYAHERQLRNGNHFNPKFQNCFNKHGEESFVWEVLEVMSGSSQEERKSREQWYLTELWDKQQILNIRKDATVPNYIPPVSEETRLKMSHTAKNNPNCVAAQFKQGHKGMVGEDNPMFGKPSPTRGKQLSEEHKAAIGRANSGKIRAQETLEKLSLAHQGQHNSTGTEFKSGAQHPYFGSSSPMKGRKHTKETKKKMSRPKVIANIQLVSPTGEVFTEVVGIGEFAKQHGLNSDDLSLLLRSKIPIYKGWLLAKANL